MKLSDISFSRLQNQHLIGQRFQTPEEVVSHLGAVQAQDYFGAMWSVGQRLENATQESIEEVFNEGRIIRTHVMRPTWHFVIPEDVRWMQKLTSHRVKQLMNTYNKKLELTDEVFKKASQLFITHLKNKNYLTRQEIKKILEGIGIKTDVQRLAHLLMYPELDALICSGPRKGKQFTYALLEERVETSKTLDHDEALATLTLKYFASHGPAQLKDFSWWSGLTMKESTEGLSFIKSRLNEEIIDKKIYFSVPNTNFKVSTPSPAFLLSIYDEYTIAYKDRSALGGEKYVGKLLSMGNFLTAVLVLEGEIAGTWKRSITKKEIEVRLDSFRRLDHNEKRSLEKAVSEYGKFIGLPSVSVYI